ncbi:MAG: TIGR04002 family protein [Oscillospiraceae bacterium]|nr:TIGR04002 family protein [Oscillospiraceae bacterium]
MKAAAKNKTLLRAVLSAMFLALTVVLTAFIKIPIGLGGYVHFGDMMIYLSAALLPLPYAAVTAGIGGILSDVVAGYPFYAPFSLVIKALLAFCFTSKRDAVLCKRNSAGIGFAAFVTIAGYFIGDVIMYGVAGAYPWIPFNLAQAAASGVLFIVIGKAIDRAGFKKRYLM